jgi:hypothetical protein
MGSRDNDYLFAPLATVFRFSSARRKLLALGPRSSRFDVLGGREILLMVAMLTIRRFLVVGPLRGAES